MMPKIKEEDISTVKPMIPVCKNGLLSRNVKYEIKIAEDNPATKKMITVFSDICILCPKPIKRKARESEVRMIAIILYTTKTVGEPDLPPFFSRCPIYTKTAAATIEQSSIKIGLPSICANTVNGFNSRGFQFLCGVRTFEL